MEIKRAKEIVERKTSIPLGDESFDEISEAYDMAAGALDFRIPKKVEYESDGFADGNPVYDAASCPNCGYLFEQDTLIWMSNFCPTCGQALDWSFSEDKE